MPMNPSRRSYLRSKMDEAIDFLLEEEPTITLQERSHASAVIAAISLALIEDNTSIIARYPA